jgi:hypothetical protein
MAKPVQELASYIFYQNSAFWLEQFSENHFFYVLMVCAGEIKFTRKYFPCSKGTTGDVHRCSITPKSFPSFQNGWTKFNYIVVPMQIHYIH